MTNECYNAIRFSKKKKLKYHNNTIFTGIKIGYAIV